MIRSDSGLSLSGSGIGLALICGLIEEGMKNKNFNIVKQKNKGRSVFIRSDLLCYHSGQSPALRFIH